MYKDLKAHLAALTRDLDTASPARARELLNYHLIRVRDFQHERLVHLLVTFFFGALLITSIAALFAFSQTSGLALATLLLTIVTGLLFITELSYIAYYFFLENSVQKLYALTQALDRKIRS